MTVTYHRNIDLLYICLDENAQQTTNQDLADDVHLELGEAGRIVGIEILDASKRVDVATLVSMTYAEVA